MSDFRNIVVPYDFSIHARSALATAINLAKRIEGSELHLLHVVQMPTYAYPGAAMPPTAALDIEAICDSARKSLAEIVEFHGDLPPGTEVHVVAGLGIADSIRESSEAIDADLIVMGTHGRTGLAHVFIGSVTERTLRIAPCPVVAVRTDESEDSDTPT
jgi:nucleotide-binding universal stress UspA family protein